MTQLYNCITLCICVLLTRISWKLDKHPCLTSSCCADFSYWLKTQLVMNSKAGDNRRALPRNDLVRLHVRIGTTERSRCQELGFSTQPETLHYHTFVSFSQIPVKKHVFALLVWSQVTRSESATDEKGKKISTVQRGTEQLTGSIAQA